MNVVKEILLSKRVCKGLGETLPKAGLAGRICYSSKPVIEIISEDKRFEDKQSLSDYLMRLVERRHYSVFEHSYVEISLEEIGKILAERIDRTSVEDLLKDVFPEILPLLAYIGRRPNQGIPVYTTKGFQEPELQGLAGIGFTGLLRTFHILPRQENKVAINMRHFLELAEKVSKDEDEFKSLVEKVFSYIPEEPRKALFYQKKSQDGYFNVYFIGVQNNDRATFVVEGCSRVLTHQLVRHRLYSSYSQRSLRYTKVESPEDFVIPPLDYIEGDIQPVIDVFKDSYTSSLSSYQTLLNVGVRKEDARFVIPSGVRTTIMTTMLYDGLRNFIKERTNSHAQCEIRKLAEIVKDEISNWGVIEKCE